MKKLYLFFYYNKGPFIGLGLSAFIIWRFNLNFSEFGKAVNKEKLFNAKKSNDQLKVYRELYDPNEGSKEKKNYLLNVASEEDKQKIKDIFNQYENLDEEEVNNQMDYIKYQIELLDKRKSEHQGIKLSRILYGYEASEDTLKAMRNQNKKDKLQNSEKNN